MTTNEERIQAVDVRNFNMSFGRMVVFMVKWAIATIPALIILILVGYTAVAVLRAFERATIAGRTLDRNFGSSSLAAPLVSRAEFEAEMGRARDLLMAGKPWEAYGMARRLESRTAGAQKSAAQGLMDDARKQTQMAKP